MFLSNTFQPHYDISKPANFKHKKIQQPVTEPSKQRVTYQCQTERETNKLLTGFSKSSGLVLQKNMSIIRFYQFKSQWHKSIHSHTCMFLKQAYILQFNLWFIMPFNFLTRKVLQVEKYKRFQEYIQLKTESSKDFTWPLSHTCTVAQEQKCIVFNCERKSE